ncbi:hypothetical protein BsWGS_03263 [Bradybaena similaris]
MEVSISCILKHTNNEILWRSEQKHRNGLLIWEFRQNGQTSEFLKKTEQELLGGEFIGITEHKEQDNKLVRDCEQSKQENILGEAQQIVQITKFPGKLNGVYKKPEQSNKLILKIKQKEQKNKHFGKSEQEEQNRTCTLNTFLNYRMQNTASPCTHNSNGGFSCCLLFKYITSLTYSDELLNELHVCEYGLFCDSKNIGIIYQTSFLSDDDTHLAFKLVVIVWLPLPQNLVPLAASVAEGSSRRVSDCCTAVKSDMTPLEMNDMNINKFKSDLKNLMCVKVDNSKLKKIKGYSKNVYQRIGGHNTKAICLEDSFLKGGDMFLKGCVHFSLAQRYCLKSNNNQMGRASYRQGQCAKYDPYIYIVSRQRAHTTCHITSTGCVRSYIPACHITSTGCVRSNIPAKADTVRVLANQDSAGRDSSAERSHVSSLNAVGMIRICLIDVLSIGCTSASTSSVKEEHCLDMLLLLGDGVCFNILRFIFCRCFQGHEVTVIACKQNGNGVSSNVSHLNINKQFSYLFCQHEDYIFPNSTRDIQINTPHFHHSHCSIWKENRFIRLRHDRVGVKQNGYRSGRVTFCVMYTKIPFESKITRNEVNSTVHHKLINYQIMCFNYLPKPCYIVSNSYFSSSKLCSQFGGFSSIRSPDMKLNFHMPAYRPRHFLTCRSKTKACITIVGILQHIMLVSNEKDTTHSLPSQPTPELCLLDDYKKSNTRKTMFRSIISTFYRKRRSRGIGKETVEKGHPIIKSANVKGRQAMISNTTTDLNQNSFRTEASAAKNDAYRSHDSSAGNSDEEDDDTDVTSEGGDEEEDKFAAKTARIKSNIECMDNFLIIWHSGFLILFLVLLGVGIVLRVYFSTIIERSVKSSANYELYSHFVKIENVPDKLEFGNLTEVLGQALIVLSSLYIVCILCYMTFLMHRITYTIPLVVIVTGAIVLTEVNIINIYMSPVSAANEQAKKELKERAEKEYAVDSNKPFSVTYDLISIWGHCCGIVDQYDFQNVMLKYFLPTKSEYKTLQVPPTCCEPRHFEKGVENVVDCASTAEGIFNVGCYQTIYIWLRLYCNLYSFVVVVQLLDLCIHIILYKKHLSLLMLQEARTQKSQIAI